MSVFQSIGKFLLGEEALEAIKAEAIVKFREAYDAKHVTKDVFEEAKHNHGLESFKKGYSNGQADYAQMCSDGNLTNNSYLNGFVNANLHSDQRTKIIEVIQNTNNVIKRKAAVLAIVKESVVDKVLADAVASAVIYLHVPATTKEA